MVVLADELFREIQLQLQMGHMTSFTISGMSMWPFLCHGRDQVILKAARPELLKKGAIVLLRKDDGSYLVHRITGIREDYIQTTGDGKLCRDGWFRKDQILAVADQVVRKGRTISCSSIGWKVQSALWMSAWPIRKELLWMMGGILRVSRRIRE